jgi:tRNA A-37 threonylcarbamoyl transferase component Bud32
LRIRCVFGLALVLVLLAAATAHADRGGRGRGGGGGGGKWRDTSDWALRAPRAFGRATRDALEKLAPIDSAIRATREATEALEPEPPYEDEPPMARDEPVEPRRSVEPEPAPEPEPPTEAVAEPVAPAAEPQVELPPLETAHAWLDAIEIGAAIALALLVAAYAWTRRRGVPVEVPIVAHVVAPLALPVGVVAPRARTAIDVEVEDVVAKQDVAAEPFPGGGRYEILEEIGRGGMGVVYKARDKRLDRVVALKRLPDMLESEPRYVELLLREARSAARLNHRNIVTVHDVDRESDFWFITMEYLEGASLAATLRQHKRVAPRSVVWLGEQIVAGLGYAHAQGIVHRDVKPANLLVTKDHTLKLMDFGVAKILEEARRKRTLIGGTPAYMAPEQAAGAVVDGRTDLYALGATFFELLTGAVPFAEGDPLHHHRSTEAPDPRAHATGIPDPLAELILALMRKDPAERPASAADVAVQLRAIRVALPPARSAA